ncbi:glycosyltransferase family A protein [Enterococcus faecium]|uniref:glycosyltransferase family A protein n=1 Tax=Enterococcus TaxID=1350 RepID=UPI00163BF0CC|nr:glycosyltransferase family 2 protein [Enterococcus faecium]MDQ8328411.1 glycosyltransferase family 2 protein [Enterococcus faecium]
MIIPFFKGERFIDRINKNISSLVKSGKERGVSIEIIIVNDNPSGFIPNFEEKVIKINNEKNSGIHFSRTQGLKFSTGSYILFLDQDDEIYGKEVINNYFFSIKNNSDVSVTNGFFGFKNGEKKSIYSNKLYKNNTCNEFFYVNVKDLIISPGHCLIKRTSIPKEWIDNIMYFNGTDDYLLWLLMFNESKKFIYYDIFTYCHHDTGSNVSFDTKNWRQSLSELENTLLNISKYPNRKVRRIQRTNSYKYSLVVNSKPRFFVDSILNFDLFIINVLFVLTNGFTVLKHSELKD